MIETILWVVGTSTTLTFCWRHSANKGFKKGYKAGAEDVLDEWKKFNNGGDSNE